MFDGAILRLQYCLDQKKKTSNRVSRIAIRATKYVSLASSENGE